ncbi:hypothetical protein [Listeria welshimeri]|uniref:hypothetical protein n=1 Tax=Listeria welshimeri TaxID=1643 RepID=UPI001623D3FF|nr:hypothetical protein [Listeria welshimeri]MBC1319798.1 hypothetical protein [Listeria welshimeri]MBC1340914.1 hypothetical protein [Listeria welshimeri]MBC1346960.1 hypothetical protein [Listeria welshimeri]MBC1350805.1 hypothetical protein [Listeria welshimeri]MBC1355586.1 hypothetical protein [Listeria welshimeri]
MADVSEYESKISICNSNKQALKNLKEYVHTQEAFYEENHANVKKIKSTYSDFKGKNADETADNIEDLQSANDDYFSGLEDMKAEINRLIDAQNQAVNGYKSLIKAEENKDLYKRP